MGLDPFDMPQPRVYEDLQSSGVSTVYTGKTPSKDTFKQLVEGHYPSKQPQRWMVTCTSSVLTIAPVMLESRLMNSSSNCLTLSGISLIMILTRWSSRRM